MMLVTSEASKGSLMPNAVSGSAPSMISFSIIGIGVPSRNITAKTNFNLIFDASPAAPNNPSAVLYTAASSLLVKEVIIVLFHRSLTNKILHKKSVREPRFIFNEASPNALLQNKQFTPR